MRSRHRGEVAHLATNGLGFRLVLATLLAVAAMFGGWALDLAVKDTLLSPPAEVTGAGQAAVPTTAPASTEQAVAGSTEYVVRRGDTLRGIAIERYHDESRWQQIFAANRDRVDDPQNLLIGTRLRMPPL